MVVLIVDYKTVTGECVYNGVTSHLAVKQYIPVWQCAFRRLTVGYIRDIGRSAWFLDSAFLQ